MSALAPVFSVSLVYRKELNLMLKVIGLLIALYSLMPQDSLILEAKIYTIRLMPCLKLESFLSSLISYLP